MRHASLLGLALALVLLPVGASPVRADAVFFPLRSGTFSQDWTDASLIMSNDSWSRVPSIEGYRGDDAVMATDVDPQVILGEGTLVLDVNANQTSPGTFATGGVAEFALANPTVALQASGTADAPSLLLYLDTRARADVRVSYVLRDLDDSTDDAVTAVALQYRVGTSGPFVNVPAGFVADATTGPSQATRTTALSALLPAAAWNQAQLEIRIITSNTAGTDEWVGVDDLVVTGSSTCGNGTIELGEGCDEGAANGATTCGCSTSCHVAGLGTPCGMPIGACAATSVCTGLGDCAPTYLPAGTVCRPSVGLCDFQETCDGTSPSCPNDAVASAGTVCGPSNGAPCDLPDRCDGVGGVCPALVAPPTQVCRASTGLCDPDETCDGTSTACPPAALSPAGTVCRAAAGDCDAAEVCTGTSAACPNDVFFGTGALCRAARDLCDAPESCTGVTAACPADGFAPNGTACDDGLRCNGLSVCTAGVCGAGVAITCNDGNACTTDLCQEPGVCMFGAIPGCCSVDAECGDGDACTRDHCVASACVHDPICDAGGATDAGAEPDAGAMEDASVVVDAGTDASVETDAATTPDASVEMDAAVTGNDAGMAIDAATDDAAVEADAAVEIDAGTLPIDVGVPARDASTDGGGDASARADARVEVDASSAIVMSTGCGCRVARTRGPSSWLVPLLGVAALAWRARRRARGRRA